MTTFLQRYQQGAYEEVWADLLALGKQARREPLYSDTLSVAYETMRRVKYNIKLLIPRLYDVGFHFYHYGQDIFENFTPEESAETHQALPIFSDPSENVEDLITAIERKGGGKPPLSVEVFYKVVGTVNFAGTHPQWNTCSNLDPLQVLSVELAQEMCDIYGDDNRYQVPIGFDEYTKEGAGGSGPYTIALGDGAIDALLEGEWHNTTFVNYLRISFRWGGFPGLERCKSPPLQDLAYLTEGLLPI